MKAESRLVAPIILLSPGRSFSTLASAMLGRHPSLCALPETCLLLRDSMLAYERDLGAGIYREGLLHSIETLLLDDQGDAARRDAISWLEGRRGDSTLSIFDEFRRKVAPKIVVEKTPAITSDSKHFERIESLFQRQVRYIHLTRHPRSYGRSLLETFQATIRNVGPHVAMRSLCFRESLYFGSVDAKTGVMDPQISWFERNQRIDGFLSTIDHCRFMRIQGEEFVSNPRSILMRVVEWLRLPTQPRDIEGMLRPEEWVFAKRRDAGNIGDRKFFANPALRPRKEPESLDGGLSWRRDCAGFSRSVKELATKYGYV